MEVVSLCLTFSATLNILPNRRQFFNYDRFALTCVAPARSSAWTLWRNTSWRTFEACNASRGLSQRSDCTIEDAYEADSGVYWCQSEHGECSNTVSVAVTSAAVILESPALPATVEEAVTLRCLHRAQGNSKATSDFSTKFYKDGVSIGTRPSGNITLPSVSKADEGFYKCEHPTGGQSAESWLSVSVGPQPLPKCIQRPLYIILLVVLHVVMLSVSVCACWKWAKAGAEAKRASERHLPE